MAYKKSKYLFISCFFFFVFLLSAEAQSSDVFSSTESLNSTLLNIKDSQSFQKIFISFTSKTTVQNDEFFTLLYPYYEKYYEAFDISAKPASVRFLFAFVKKTKLETENAKLIASLQKYLYYLLSFQDTANAIYTDKTLSLFIGFQISENFLQKKQVDTLSALISPLLKNPSFHAKALLLDLLFSWPLYKDQKKYDSSAMRNLLSQIMAFDTRFYDYFVNILSSKKNSLRLDEAKIVKALVKETLTDGELKYLLCRLLTHKVNNGLSEMLVDVPLYKIYYEALLKKSLTAAIKESPVKEEFLLLQYYLRKLNAEKNLSLKEIALTEKDLVATIIKESDDFKASLQFKILEPYAFTDSEILLLLDIKKPSLSAMVLDYRFGKNYPNFNYMVKVSPLVEDESTEAKLFKSKVQAFLLEALKTKDENLVLVALKSLYALNDTNLLTQIIILCDSPFPLVRAYSFYGIHVYGDSRFVAACLKRLYDENTEVREFAIQTLGRLRDGRAVDPLGKILLDKTEDPHIRTLAAKALGDIGDTRTTQIFKTILIDASSPFGARVAAAIFMGAKKEKSAVDALINALDPNTVSELNWACIDSLGRIDDATGKRKLAAIVSKSLTKWTSNNFTFDHVANSLWVCINLEDKNLVLALEDLYSKNAASIKHPFFIALYLYQFGSHRGDFELLLQTDYAVWFKNSDYEIYLYALVLDKLKGSFYDELALNLYPLSDTITKIWLISVCSKRDKAEYLSMFKDILISENLKLESWLPTLNSSLIRYIEANKNKAETSKFLEEMILLTKNALEKKKERNLDSSVLEKVLTRLELVKIVK